jgi:ribonuclease BN (tRNA processing enzyme)
VRGKQKQKIEDMEYSRKIINFSKGADLLIIDAQYTKEEYKEKRGWGHSIYLDVLEIGLAADVKRLALFHHDPTHTDDKMNKIVSECQSIIKKRGSKIECFGAQEGMVITL